MKSMKRRMMPRYGKKEKQKTKSKSKGKRKRTY
ncbi:MAG: hypothetical protein CM15mV145_280 [uncultured marine virus]|nr:MAG: hypothetical protein CM15mV145_280 [uncultured marine virus]